MLGNLGVLHQNQGRMAQAQAHYEQALAIFQEMGKRSGEGAALGYLGDLSYEQGRSEESRTYYEQALAIHRELSYLADQGSWLYGLARLASDAGSDGWSALADEAVEVSADYPIVQAAALSVRAELRLNHGDTEQARADVDAARAHRQKGDVAAHVALADARVCHAEARHQQARSALQEAQALAEQLHAGPASPLGMDLIRVRELLSEPPLG